MKHPNRLWPVAVVVVVGFTPSAALAYVGPGAGLSLVGALWAVLVALATAVVFVAAWPVRRALRRRRQQGAAQEGTERNSPTAPSSGAGHRSG